MPSGFSPKSRIFAPLCNSITRQSIVLESCSNPEKAQQVFQFAMKKCSVLGFVFFVGEVISEVGLGLFGP